MDIADTRMSPGAAASVTALYAEHALGLVRLAVVMTGNRAAAEDVVQDAFLGLYRRWDQLPDITAPLAYVRTSVVNGCRTALRRRSRLGLWSAAGSGGDLDELSPAAGFGTESAEARALLSEEQREVAAALRKLPRRQREASSSATTSTCPSKRPRRSGASARAPSSPPPTAGSPPSAGS